MAKTSARSKQPTGRPARPARQIAAANATGIPETYAARIAAVRERLAREKLDGLLLNRRTDQVWLTGFTGEDGALLVTSRGVTLISDGRFEETARREAPWAKAIIRKQRGPDSIAIVLKAQRLTKVGFDPDQTSHALFLGLRKAAPKIDLNPCGGWLSAAREVKIDDEISRIRRAVAVAERAFLKVKKSLRPDLTERQIAAALVYEMTRGGASGPAFAPIVATGANAALPHYAPEDVPIGRSGLLLIDWGAKVDGYVSDLTRVIALGTVPPNLAAAYRAVRGAHDRAVAAAKPGLPCARLDRVARSHLSQAGLSKAFNHSLGHGIGLDVHELPSLRKSNKATLQVGNVITIEPGAYLPGVGGVRLESDVWITKDGAEVLSSLPLDW
ncbi:MAG: Xaa-Pro peptidase family protein [Phycisphaerae bacterium]|nr:Xaa-Pro peptidase family protein [Phycisphaerae bacterium]